ncbi:MAG: CehA/McbA family metallohydrolase, partial [Firmicutes bacterium]|nr:CehA/McbA family metallohydrolase [Bacillota bacterium]
GATRLQWWGLRLGEPLIVPARLDEGTSLWPGAVPGLLPAGGWHLLLGGVARNGEGPRYRVEVTAGTGARPDEPQTDARPVAWLSGAARPGNPAYDRYGREHAAAAGARWYRGDLHLHTLLSDSRLSADLLSRLALERGLDFAVITEHNTLTTAWVTTSLLVIPGVELTSTRGHVNVLGVRSFPPLWYGEDPTLESEPAIDRLLTAYAAEGAVCSVNHPLLEPWPTTPATPPTRLPRAGARPLGRNVAVRLPRVGRRRQRRPPLAGRAPGAGRTAPGGGGPHHLRVGRGPHARRRGRGHPTRSGVVTCGPTLAPEAVVGGERRLPGEDLAPEGGPVELEYSLRVEEGPDEGWVRWVDNGEEVALEPLSPRGRHSLRRRCRPAPTAGCGSRCSTGRGTCGVRQPCLRPRPLSAARAAMGRGGGTRAARRRGRAGVTRRARSGRTPRSSRRGR